MVHSASDKEKRRKVVLLPIDIWQLRAHSFSSDTSEFRLVRVNFSECIVQRSVKCSGTECSEQCAAVK